MKLAEEEEREALDMQHGRLSGREGLWNRATYGEVVTNDIQYEILGTYQGSRADIVVS